MTTKEIVFDNDSRKQIGRDVDTLANTVKVTLKPSGQNVIHEQSLGAPAITKEAQGAARQVQLENHLANMGAEMVKEVAAKTAAVAGDGTTTATVLEGMPFDCGYAAPCAPWLLSMGLGAPLAAGHPSP